MRNITIAPEDFIYEIFVVGDYVYLEQSIKIPISDIVNSQPAGRLRVTVGGDRRTTIGMEERSAKE